MSKELEFLFSVYGTPKQRHPALLTYKPQRAPVSVLRDCTEGIHPLMHHNGLRSLLDHEAVQNSDIVEDVLTGEREPVKAGYYGFLRGYAAGTARKLPSVHDVLRRY